MSVRFALISCLLASIATPSLAQDNGASPAQAADAKPVKEKKTCVSDNDTGSIMPHRTCHTKAEWDEINKASATAGGTSGGQRTGRVVN